MNDQEVEKEIEEKGLNAPRISLEHVNSLISIVEYHVFANSTLTVCCITLDNGFTVTGESACASYENYNKQLGEKIAYEKAKSKIWMLEGYLLKDKLHNGPQNDEPVDPEAEYKPSKLRRSPLKVGPTAIKQRSQSIYDDVGMSTMAADYFTDFGKFFPEQGSKPTKPAEDNVMPFEQTALCVDGPMLGDRVSEYRKSWKVEDGNGNIEYHLVRFITDDGFWVAWATNKHINFLKAVAGLTQALAMRSGRDHSAGSRIKK
jgi:hypothetical protein